jgi:signal transduction histidine kinase
METYVHTVTHDLRAPLRAIQGFGLALVEDHLEELSPTARAYVERMIAGAERMDLLMRELLAYSRLGHLELHLQGVDLSAIEREAETLIASELEHSAARVVVDGPLGEVRGHTPTLVQVMANLLSNAAKFVPEGCKPEIRLRPEPRGTRLRLWVEDNGIGIPHEARDRIWGVFERLHGMDAYPGSGLGLAIVRRALERMHGTCGVESEPGAGSRFWIELDAAEPREPGTQDGGSSQSAGRVG